MSSASGWKSPSGLMDNTRRVDLEVAWPEREEEAASLRASGSRAMEICLRFYALVIRIKAMICKHLGLDLLPRGCKTHDLSELLIFSGHHRTLLESADSPIQESWDRLAKFSKERLNDVRYLPDASLSDEDYRTLSDGFDESSRGTHAWLSGLP